MAFSNDSNSAMYMPVAPAYMGGYNNGGFGGFGGDGWWLILLLLCGWGGGFGGGFGGWGGMMGMGMEFPWLLNGQNGINNNVNDGFRTAQLSDSVTSVRDGVSNLATQLCGCCGDIQMGMANGFAGVQQSLCNGFAGTTAAITGAQNALSQQLNTNEMASLNRSFAEQTANMQGFNGVNAGIADTRYTIATEACATRTNDTQNTNTLLTALTAGVQSIKDQLCQDKIDAKNDEIAQLRQEVLYARGQASQTDQTAQILANNNAQTALFNQGLNNEVDALYNRLKNCPVPSMPVYGMQPIFQCQPQNNCGCGCGCGA
jgi:hypothetical protein